MTTRRKKKKEDVPVLKILYTMLENEVQNKVVQILKMHGIYYIRIASASKNGQLTGVISSSMTRVMNKTFKQIASDHFLGKIDSATAIKQLEALQE